jgi:acyl carrier protein
MVPAESQLRERLSEMVSQACDGEVSPAEVRTAGASLAELGVGSLAQLRLIDDIEMEFGVAFDLAGDISYLDSLDSLTRYLTEQGAAVRR